MYKIRGLSLRKVELHNVFLSVRRSRYSTHATTNEARSADTGRGTNLRIRYPDEDKAAYSHRPITFRYPDTNSTIQVEKLFLRDACSCPRCVDPSTSQKLFETADIPLSIELESHRYLSDGSIEIQWQNDISGYYPHTSTFSPKFFAKNYNDRARVLDSHEFPRRVSWNKNLITMKHRTFPYREYLESMDTIHEALNHLHCYGILFLNSVPSEISAIERIANRIGPLRNTFYGPTWDVRSVPSAKNVAYTSQNLGFHMDLLYMASPPGLQILHTMTASTQGGESLFSDGLNACYRMSKEAPENLASLYNFQVTYRYKNDGHWYQQDRTTLCYPIEFDASGSEIPDLTGHEQEINWSPPFQGPFKRGIGMKDISRNEEPDSELSALRIYLKAAKAFKTFLEAEDTVFETKMEEGTCVIFDNRRILHARKSFNSDSERWLRGAYVDKDPLKSRLRVMNEQLGIPKE
ncbi:hypothetical protein MMC18_000870 [Xylographa bjoerkii]|nr:hypothetical protein [Xylographa bjoerkii]